MTNRTYGEETVYQDRIGTSLSLDALCQIVEAARVATAVLSKSEVQIRRPLDEQRIRLSESIARAQRALRIIMIQRLPVLRLEIAVSIDILCCTLAKIIHVILGDVIEKHVPSFSRKFEELMIQRNWCPSRIADLTVSDNTCLSYVSSLLPSYETTSHKTCSPRKCLKRPSSLTGMARLHRGDCDRRCPPIVIPENELARMWKEGQIPGLRLLGGHHLLKTIN